MDGSAFSSQTSTNKRSALSLAGGGLQQGFEDAELLRGEGEVDTVTTGAVIKRVEFDPGGPQHAAPCGGAPAGKS